MDQREVKKVLASQDMPHGSRGLASGPEPEPLHLLVDIWLLQRSLGLSVCTACALRVHCVRTACILRTQRLGYSPNNTCHLFTRGKTERCQYHRVG